MSLLLADIVVKRFLVLERGIIFQERVRMENIDSRIPSFGFCYCLLQMVDGSLADFCNTIGQKQTSPHVRVVTALPPTRTSIEALLICNELWLSSARDRPVACRARHVGRNPPGVRSAWLYKQQSRRPMSENRRLCLAPNAPSSSFSSEGHRRVPRKRTTFARSSPASSVRGPSSR